MILEKIPKARYAIVNVMGDLYYKELPIEEAVQLIVNRIPPEQALKSREDYHKFIEERLNVEIP